MVSTSNPVLVVIDPGHGGTRSVGGSNGNNAKGPKGTLEKDLTLSISLMVGGLLANLGHDVKFTRAKDTNLGLADRAAVAKDAGATIFVSIHLNGFHDASVQGSETLVAPNASPDSIRLAESIQRSVVDELGHRDRGVKPQSLGVLRPERHLATTAACLVEPCFLTNPDEEARLQTESYQLRIATAIATGIAHFVEQRPAPSE